jgi:hypothetical protein
VKTKEFRLQLVSALIGLMIAAFAGLCPAAGIQSEQGGDVWCGTSTKINSLQWNPYAERYAIVVMGGHVTGPPHYQWYWGDTGGMYNELVSYGFTADNVFFLSYGDSAGIHPDWVDTLSTTACVVAAFQWAQARCRPNDLLYIYWVDHGSTVSFDTYDGIITHAELGTLIGAIDAKVVIGAYNPCYSGCVIDDVSGPRVITITSQDCYNPNSWGWAGKWRRALRGAPEDSVDTDEDGYISMTEAYNWIAPQSQAAGEHSMFDDNGDGVGHEWGQPGYDPDDPSQDGYNGRFYSLGGWAEYGEYEVTIDDDYSYPQNLDYDYGLDSADIGFSDDKPSVGDTITITAGIHNYGLCRAGSAWGWYDPDGRSCWAEWDFDYPATGTVDISYRCRDAATVEWRVELDGFHLVDVDVPPAATGESWKLVTIHDFPIASGPHTIFLGTYTMDGYPDPDYRLDWIQVGDVRIEAETYDRSGGNDPDPDLQGLGISPSGANPPQSTNLTVQIWDGDPSSGGTLLLEDFVGDTNEVHDPGDHYPEHTYWAHYIENNGEASVEVGWIPADTGTHQMYVVVDPHDVLEEIDETNNVAHKTVKVQPPTPHILYTSPTSNDLNVSDNANIEVIFDIYMDASTINQSTFVVNARSTGLSQGSISYNYPTKTATFDPFDDFDAGEVVTVALTTEIRSSEEIPLDSSYIWSFTIVVEDGGACFAYDSSYLVGTGPRSVFAADLDGDGDLDLATADSESDSVSVLLNDGTGTFVRDSVYQVGNAPASIFAADLDGDGDLDLVTPNGWSDNVSVLLNNGDGTFAYQSVYSVGNYPYSVFAADLDGDGDLDLAITNMDADNVSILLNDGSANFGSHYTYPVGTKPRSVFAADVDGDGDLDLITGNSISDDVSALSNNGDGTFAAQTLYEAGGGCRSVFAADLDGDGDLDLATADSECDSVSVLLNNGDGTFVRDAAYQVGESPYLVFAADLDGDGDLDLTSANAVSDNVSVLLNQGDGTFILQLHYGVGDYPVSVFAADLDGDADLDLATSNVDSRSVSILLNCTFYGDCNGDGVTNVGDVVYLISYLYKGGPAPDPPEIGDVNCDGVVDIGDAVFLVNYLFKGGPPPCCGCASDGGLAGDCGGFKPRQAALETAGPAQVGLVVSKRSKAGTKLAEVEGSCGVELAGIQLELSYNPEEMEKIVPALTDRTKHFDLFFSAEGRKLHVGIVDLTGEHLIAAGDGPLLRLVVKGSNLSSLSLERATLVNQQAVPLDVTILSKEETAEAVPQDFALLQNHPNPFNPETEISYVLPNACRVELSVCNLLGRRIRTLVDEDQAAGHKTVRWDGADEEGNQVASGVYFYRIKAGDFTEARKMILMK